MLRQLVYVSSSEPPGTKVALASIFEQSRHNNVLDGVSGLLLSDGVRFVQVLEGSVDAVEATMTRIRRDPRHGRVQVLTDAIVTAREFGSWAMADRFRDERTDEFDGRVRQLLGHASPETREAFLQLLESAEAA